MPEVVTGGKKGDIFWNLDPWMVYVPGYDIGVRIFVANTTESEKEYSLMANITSDDTLISEEAIPVYNHAWFKVKPGDFVTLNGSLRYEETDVELTVMLIERETEEVTDSVSTRLMAPGGTQVSALPPTWPTTTSEPFDFSWMMPVMMMAMIAPLVRTGEERNDG